MVALCNKMHDLKIFFESYQKEALECDKQFSWDIIGSGWWFGIVVEIAPIHALFAINQYVFGIKVE